MRGGIHRRVQRLSLLLALILAGNSAATPEAHATGSPNFLTAPGNAFADMNASMRASALKANPLRADLDGNRSLGAADFSILRGCLLGSGAANCSLADFDSNGSVDGDDLKLFKLAFAESGRLVTAHFALVPEPNSLILLCGGLLLLARGGSRTVRP